MKTVKFYTLGCKVNQYDTQSIRERFLESGFKELTNSHPAKFCLINTCTVTRKADSDSRYYILKAKRQNPQAKIIVTGCLAKNGAGWLSRIRGIDYIVSKSFFPDGISRFSGHTRAFLKIQDGCNNFCSYCKVPLVRGRSRSRPLKEIAAEAKRLAQNGFKEIVLTGICLGAYGSDLKPRKNLVDIINGLEKIPGLLRIRLSSIEAGDISDELVEKMAHSEKLCRHLHIPIQSGDDTILKKMNRKYTHASYRALIKKIRKKISGIAITTDCLVGFPGESESNFQHTLDLVKAVLPLKVHIFPYSERENTPAASLRDKVNPSVVKARILRLKNLAQECTDSFRNQFLNKKVDVLFERNLGQNPHLWEGYTDNYIKVVANSRRNRQNQLASVKLAKINKEDIRAFFTC